MGVLLVTSAIGGVVILIPGLVVTRCRGLGADDAIGGDAYCGILLLVDGTCGPLLFFGFVGYVGSIAGPYHGLGVWIFNNIFRLLYGFECEV